MINNKVLGLLGLARKAGKVCFGTDACMQEIEKKKIKLIIIARDAADRTKINFSNICNKNKIPIFEIFSIDEISNAIGMSNKAVIGIKDTNFSKEVLKIINGGEAIG